MKKEKNTKKSLVTASIAAATCGALILTGTFAWQSISQTAKNEVMGEVNPGGRLHDDFNGKNKDIYVENFMSTNEGGVPLITRIRLFEYMETGTDAGLDFGNSSRQATSVITGADVNSVSTWHLHRFADLDESDVVNGTDNAVENGHEDTLHAYWQWKYGGNGVDNNGQKYYMPTFNKNKDSLYADINGTWAGTGSGMSFGDYIEWGPTAQNTATGDEIYDSDNNTDDEYSDPNHATTPGATGYGCSADYATTNNYVKVNPNVQHTATVTCTSHVISMADWLELSDEQKIGDFWVYDTDGWAYWANPLQPGTATGLLLDEINLTGAISERWYYSIYADCEIVTADDLNKDDHTGFYESGKEPSENAEKLLELVGKKIDDNFSLTSTSGN